MTIAELDEVDYDLEVDGQQVRRQLSRRIWERGGWATVACAFQERAEDGAWKPVKVALVRFRKRHDVWERQAQLTLAADEARELAEALASWTSGEP